MIGEYRFPFPSTGTGAAPEVPLRLTTDEPDEMLTICQTSGDEGLSV